MPLSEGLFRSQDQAESDLTNGPGWTIDEQRPSTWEGFGITPALRGAGQGIANGISALAKGLQFEPPTSAMDAVMDGPMAASYAAEHPEHPGAPLEPWKEAWNQEAQTEAQKAHALAKELMPDPRTTGSGANLLQGFSRAVTEFGAGALEGGPVGGAMVIGTTEGYGRYLDLKDQGVDEDTARKSGILTGITNAAGAVLPMALPGKFIAGLSAPATLLTQAGAGAVINTSFGAVARAGDAKILRDAGYSDMADQMEPWDKWNLATDAITGAFFGAHAGYARLRDMPVDPSVRDAARVVQDRQETINRAPGVPVDMRSAAIHQQSLESALRDLMQDHPVSLDPDTVSGATFARPEQTPDLAARIIREEFDRAGVLQDAEEFDRWLAGKEPEPPPEVSAPEVPRGTPEGEEPKEEPLVTALRTELAGARPEFKQAFESEMKLGEAPQEAPAGEEASAEEQKEEQERQLTGAPAEAAIAARPELEIPLPRSNRPDARRDSILEFLAKHDEGLSRSESKEQGIDPADMKLTQRSRPYFRAFRKAGMSFDEAAEHLAQRGYPVVDEKGNYSANVLLDRISDELRGRPHYSLANEEHLARAEEDHAERMAEMEAQSAAEQANIHPEIPPLAEEPPEVKKLAALADRARFYDSKATDALLAEHEHPDIQTALESIIERGEQIDTERGDLARANAHAESPGGEEPFSLGTYTERDLAERERATAESDRADAANRAANEQRAQADRERGQFELTGSARPSDANPRQVDIFSAARALEDAREQEAQAGKDADIAFKAAADCGARHA